MKRCGNKERRPSKTWDFTTVSGGVINSPPLLRGQPEGVPIFSAPPEEDSLLIEPQTLVLAFSHVWKLISLIQISAGHRNVDNSS